MTLVRVVDYVANPGGGCRFVSEMLRAFRRISPARFEIVTHGSGVPTYRRIVGHEFAILDRPPRNAFRSGPPWAGRPGAALLNAVLRLPDYHFDVPPSAFEGCDVAWFPWVHRHRLPPVIPARAFGTFHDCISIEFPGVLPERWRVDEEATTARWLSSGARTIVTSCATRATVARLFPSAPTDLAVVPLSSKHDRQGRADARGAWPFAGRPYVLCPTNITPHKNVETLLDAFATWGAKVPLVLTGPGTDLANRANQRQRLLREIIARRGLVRGRDLFTLGYLSDADYYALLEGAWALAMPTLAEGGGSFPVLEAMERGIPAMCSDIPVLREMAERWNGRPIWFEPRSPDDLAAKLTELERGYDELRRAAQAQVPALLQRSWDDVALDCARLMGLELRVATTQRA